VIATAAAEAPAKRTLQRQPHVNSYVKHLMQLRMKKSTHSEPQAAVSANASAVTEKPAAVAKPAPAKKAEKSKTSMASISAKVVPVQQPGHASTNLYVAKLRAAKPAAHEEPKKVTKHAESAKVEAVHAKAAKTSEPVKAKLDKEAVVEHAETAKSKVDKKNRSAKLPEHQNADQHKVQKIDEVKAATKLHALRKEPTKVERKVEAVEVPGPKKKTAVEKVVAPKKAKHEEPVKAKAEKMVEPANPQEPKKAEVRKEPTKVERRVEVAKLPEPKKKAAVAVKAHDAAKSVTAPQSEKTADKKVAAPEAAQDTAKVPAPLPSANVEIARSTKTESAQSRDVPVSEIKKLPCQGFEGQPCRHVDTHTATGDWRSEYGPQPVRAGARASSATVAVFAAVAALMFGA